VVNGGIYLIVSYDFLQAHHHVT